MEESKKEMVRTEKVLHKKGKEKKKKEGLNM